MSRSAMSRSVTDERDTSESVTPGAPHPRASRAGVERGAFIPDSLCDKIRQFFLAQPDEELTYPDMTVKFGCTSAQARSAVKALGKRKGGAWLETVWSKQCKRAVVRVQKGGVA